eukprot:104064-Amphidinium_carterae.1
MGGTIECQRLANRDQLLGVVWVPLLLACAAFFEAALEVAAAAAMAQRYQKLERGVSLSPEL